MPKIVPFIQSGDKSRQSRIVISDIIRVQIVIIKSIKYKRKSLGEPESPAANATLGMNSNNVINIAFFILEYYLIIFILIT
jgi:hypothetical protein